MKKLHTHKLIYTCSGVGIFALTLLATAFISHSFTPPVNSDAASRSTDINLNVSSIMSLAVVNSEDATVSELAMEVTPEAGGVFTSAGAIIKASTNNGSGYQLTLSDKDGNAALINTDTTVTTNNTIPAITTPWAVTLADFPSDTWGYNFNDEKDPFETTELVYSAVPASGFASLIDTNAPSSNTYPFTVAAKISPATRAGTYQGTIVFTLTANTPSSLQPLVIFSGIIIS